MSEDAPIYYAKECPICKGDSVIYIGGKTGCVWCNTCAYKGPTANSELEAVIAWNEAKR